VVWTAPHETLAVLLKDTTDISLPAFISGLSVGILSWIVLLVWRRF